MRSAPALAALALLTSLGATAQAQIVINEVYPNPPGSGTIDDRWEYLELYGPPGMNLTGYLLASVFGGGDPDSDNIPGPLPAGWDGGDEVAEIDEGWSLDGLSIGSNGLLVIYNNNGAAAGRPSLAAPFFAPGTNSATYDASHCPTSDAAGRVKNDGSATFVLLRRRPFHAISPAGVSLYDGVPANTIVSGPLTYPPAIRYAWRKDINPDVDYNGRVDFNGIGTLVLSGGPAPVEIGVNSERAATPPVGSPWTLEPYQMVDDVAWSNGGGKEYVRSSQQELSDTSGFNPDAASRIAYFDANPGAGHIYLNGEMKPSRMADEELIYGDVLDTGPQGLPLVSYNPAAIGGPTDPAGPRYNAQGQLDAAGPYLLDNINLTGFSLTPGAFNDVDSSGSGGVSITQFRFLAGDFDFSGSVTCEDRSLLAASIGASLDDATTLTEDDNTLDPADDFSYSGWRWQGRAFNALLAMIRMDLADGSTGEWNSGVAVTAADLAAFDAAFPGICPPACDPDVNQDGNVDQDDVSYLINVVGGGDNPSGIDPDFNQDGNVDQDDVAALIDVVAGGACP